MREVAEKGRNTAQNDASLQSFWKVTILVSVSVSLGTTDVVLEYNLDTLTIGYQTITEIL